MDSTTHWQDVYTANDSGQVSWFESEPAISLQLLDATRFDSDT